MTTLEKIQTILLEYGNASLSYGMELNNGDWVKCVRSSQRKSIT